MFTTTMSRGFSNAYGTPDGFITKKPVSGSRSETFPHVSTTSPSSTRRMLAR